MTPKNPQSQKSTTTKQKEFYWIQGTCFKYRVFTSFTSYPCARPGFLPLNISKLIKVLKSCTYLRTIYHNQVDARWTGMPCSVLENLDGFEESYFIWGDYRLDICRILQDYCRRPVVDRYCMNPFSIRQQ